MEDKISSFGRLERKIHITKDAMFKASLRLIRRHHMSSYFSALLSLYVIGLSLYPNFAEPELTRNQSQLLLAATVILSVFIIILSLMETSRNFYHRGEILHDCACKLGTLINEIQATKKDEISLDEKIKCLTLKYNAIIDSCHERHDQVDYKRVQVESHYSLFPDIYDSKLPIFNKTKRSMLYLKVICIEYSWCFVPFLVVALVSVMIWKSIWLAR